eukprot:845717-Pyramimonas_sp.AAC.1
MQEGGLIVQGGCGHAPRAAGQGPVPQAKARRRRPGRCGPAATRGRGQPQGGRGRRRGQRRWQRA